MSGSSVRSENQPERLSTSFGWLNATQFLGALNDNIYKLLVTFFLIRTLGPEHSAVITGLSGIIFALPFILLIPAAGVLADRHSKSGITVVVKVAEIVVMAAAVLAFWLGWPIAGFAVLFLMAAQSAFFNPVKYGIIPELVPVHQLSRANGYLVAFTYLSIIFGTVLGPWITEVIVGKEVTDHSPNLFATAGLVCVFLAIAGTWTALRILPTPAAGTDRKISWRFWNDIRITLREHKHDRYLIMAIFASAYFSLIGAFIQLNLIPYAIRDLGLGETAGGYLFVYAALGIGAGSLMAGRLSGRNIEFGIIPVGALLIALSGILLMLLPADIRLARALMAMAGFGAGLFIIPIEAFIQLRAPREKLGAIMAANGFVGWIGILLAGIFIFVLGLIPSWRPVHTFGLLGVLTFW